MARKQYDEINPATGRHYTISPEARKRIADGARRKWAKFRAQGLGSGAGGKKPGGRKLRAYIAKTMPTAVKSNPFNPSQAQTDSIDYWASKFNAARMNAAKAELDLAHFRKEMSEASSKLKQLIDKLLLNN